jgi:hypothetical protein
MKFSLFLRKEENRGFYRTPRPGIRSVLIFSTWTEPRARLR